MSGVNSSTDYGGSHFLGMSNAREDNRGSKTRKTGRRKARNKGKQREEWLLLHVKGSSIQRSKSQSSLLSIQSAGSYGSAISAFSNFTAHAIEVDERAWEEIALLRRKHSDKINLITAEVQATVDSCSIQKNVNMTINNGLKKIKELIAAIDSDQNSATEKKIATRRGWQ